MASVGLFGFISAGALLILPPPIVNIVGGFGYTYFMASR